MIVWDERNEQALLKLYWLVVSWKAATQILSETEQTQILQKSDKSEHEWYETWRIAVYQFFLTSKWQVAASGLASSSVLPPFATSHSHPLLLETKRAGRVTHTYWIHRAYNIIWSCMYILLHITYSICCQTHSNTKNTKLVWCKWCLRFVGQLSLVLHLLHFCTLWLWLCSTFKERLFLMTIRNIVHHNCPGWPPSAHSSLAGTEHLVSENSTHRLINAESN